jgi:hypothetical protein
MMVRRGLRGFLDALDGLANSCIKDAEVIDKLKHSMKSRGVPDEVEQENYALDMNISKEITLGNFFSWILYLALSSRYVTTRTPLSKSLAIIVNNSIGESLSLSIQGSTALEYIRHKRPLSLLSAKSSYLIAVCTLQKVNPEQMAIFRIFHKIDIIAKGKTLTYIIPAFDNNF